ncbi:MAG: ABC transporter substrate-binding protein, partial [Pseudomonadota bacterium]
NYRQTYQQPRQQQTASPVDILESSINNVLKFLAQPGSNNISSLRRHVKNEIAPNFDFGYMSKWVAGKRYYMMNKKQQKLFKQKFTEVFLSTFVNKMTKNSKSLPSASRFISRRQNQNEARASVLLSYDNGQRIKVDFRFFQTAGGWKVVDVKANGISALIYFRNYFVNKIKQRKA